MPKSPYTLYKQDRSPNWSVRFTVDEKVIRKSLKTEDETEARTKAQKIYYDIILKKEAGININFSTFDSFIDHYIKHKDSKKKDCNFNLIFSVVIKKFFQNKKPNEISQEYINRYPDFRRTFGRTYTGRKYKLRKEIADGTIKLEINWINSFLGYCERQRFVTDIPRIKTNIQITRRSAFNDAEIKVVRNQLEEDIEYARRGFGKQLIKYYFEFLLYTGCRPCEWFNLKWQNINTTDDLITIFVHGKNKQRELVALPEIRLILSNLYKMQTKRLGHPPAPSDYVHEGIKKACYIRHFIDMLDRCGLKRDNMGVNRSAYCCRHTYITNMLKKGVPAYIIAKNCGTSVKMISDTYDSNTVSAYKNILIQDLYN